MRGVILYGPPTSGKDTVTAALSRRDRHYRLIPKLKVGSGNKRGYQMATYVELMNLRRRGRLVQENMRYGNVYAVDRLTVARAWDDGEIPVLHTGRLDDLRTLRHELPGPWTVVMLWCARATAQRRSIARRDVDTPDRMKVWDETRCELREIADGEVTLRIDTDEIDPEGAAGLIDAAVMRTAGRHARPPAGALPGDELRLVVPVVTLRTDRGRVDLGASLDYARRFVRWHPTAVPLVAGSYGRGDTLPRSDRLDLARLWSECLGSRPLTVAAYDSCEVDSILDLGGWPLYVPPRRAAPESIRRDLGDTVQKVWLYSHPRQFVLDPTAAASLRPRGIKLAKGGAGRLAEIRAAVGPVCDVWHATARDPATSRASGATGVVAACFADLPEPAPTSDRDIAMLAQRALRELDQMGSRERRVTALEGSVRARLVPG